jgi:hypothetical protein
MAANLPTEDLSLFIRALADPDRIRLAAALSDEEQSAVELAHCLQLAPAEIVRHLELLERAELISPIPSAGLRRYRFNRKKLEKISRDTLSAPRPRADLSSTDLDLEQRRILSNYLREDGSLIFIPEHNKRVLIVLEYIAEAIRSGEEYTEKEINVVLKRFHPDSTTLRRYLIDFGYLERDRKGSRYWMPSVTRRVPNG